MGKSFQKERIGPYRCCKGILCKDVDDSLKKKDIVKSKVRGVEIEFDHEKLATILGIPGNNGISHDEAYGLCIVSTKDHESPYGDWMTMIFEAFRVPLVIKRGEEPKKYDFFEDTFLTMCKLTEREWNMVDRKWRERRRDDNGDAPEVEAEDEDKGNKDDFDWEAMIDEATTEGESSSDEQFYDAQVEVEEPVM
ncbi:hypothetical protein Dimus_036221 [Dionaea muscipula]